MLSNGILVLMFAAAGLLVAFGGEVSALIPLFAVGLFMSFTLSQSGMVVHHWRGREPGWQRRLAVNAVGAFATAVVTVVVVVSKFTEGAWVPTLVIPLLVLLFWSIHRHYTRVDRALACPPGTPLPEIVHTVVVLVPLESARRRARVARLREVVETPVPPRGARGVRRGVRQSRCSPRGTSTTSTSTLDVVSSPYRALTRPVLQYVDALDERWQHDIVTVIIPEFVVHRWWEALLHNQARSCSRPGCCCARERSSRSVPTHID